MGESKKISEEILVDFLDCPCKVFQPMKNEEVLMKGKDLFLGLYVVMI